MRKALVLMALGCAGLAQAQPVPFQPVNSFPVPRNTTGTNAPVMLRGGAPPEVRIPQPGSLSPAAPTAGPVRENLLTFDPQSVELHWQDNRWQLLAGGVLLKDFGRRQAEGREVQRLVRELGLTQLGTVGTPQPVMEYWLAGGRAPRGMVNGLRLSPLDLAGLRIDQYQEQWCVRDAGRVLFSFGTHREEAEQALAIIRKHGFTHVGHVGHHPPAMVLFVSNPDGTTTAPVATPATLVSRATSPGNTPPAQQPAAEGPITRPPLNGMTNSLTPDRLPHGRQFGAVEPRSDLAILADQVSFDWRQVQVRREGSDWKLIFGTYILANFGSSERDARTALSAIQHYRFNQHCLVGRPNPAFSYFLVSGKAPQGVMFGLSSTPFRPEALVVRQDGNRWVVGDSVQVLIDFGDRQEEAQQTLRAIQRHRFDRLCRIGQSSAMTFFTRTR